MPTPGTFRLVAGGVSDCGGGGLVAELPWIERTDASLGMLRVSDFYGGDVFLPARGAQPWD
jgi:hypothetical protein